MKLMTLVLSQLVAVSAFAATGAVTLDPRGPVTFTSADVDCTANKLTVTRRFRSEKYPIKPDLCETIATSPLTFNQIGFDEGIVALIGYETSGAQNVIVSTN